MIHSSIARGDSLRDAIPSAASDETPADRRKRIIAMADALAERFAERAARNDASGAFPHENFVDLAEAGYLRLVLPREYGGDGVDALDMVLAQEHLARGDASTALVTAMQVNVIGRLRDDAPWPEETFATISRDLAENGGVINNCVTEAQLGSISRGGVPSTSATRADGGWLISGRKIFVTGAPALRWLVTAVVLPPSDTAPKGEIASAIVAAGSPGLRIEENWRGALSLRGCGNSDVIYENVFVPDHLIVERQPIGGAPAKKPGANAWALSVAAIYLGVGQAALDAACGYARTRIPSSLTQPISEQPHIQQWIGDMQIRLTAARSVLHEAARRWSEEPEARPTLGPLLATAKYLCTNAACDVTETALRVAGGFSLTPGLPLERFFRDARAGLFFPPQDDLALTAVGRAALASWKDGK